MQWAWLRRLIRRTDRRDTSPRDFRLRCTGGEVSATDSASQDAPAVTTPITELLLEYDRVLNVVEGCFEAPKLHHNRRLWNGGS